MLSKDEIEQIRPWVSMNVTAILGGYNPTAINTALECISKSLSRQATTEKLKSYLEHETGIFVESLYKKVLEIKSTNLTKSSAGTKRTRDGGDSEGPTSKKSKSRFDNGEQKAKTAATIGVGDSLSHKDIQAMLQNTLKQIEKKRSQTYTLAQMKDGSTGLLPTPAIPNLSHSQYSMVSGAVSQAREAAEISAREKEMRAAELQARIQSKLAAKPNLLAGMKSKQQEPPEVPTKPTPLVIDEEGKIEFPKAIRQPTIQANIRAQQKAKFKQVSREPPKKIETVERTRFLDQRVQTQTAGRGRRAFKFNEPGKYMKQGEAMRAKARIEKLQAEIASSARKTGISSATKLALIAPGGIEREDDIPLVEWWDAAILPNRTYADIDRTDPVEQKYCEISNLVEHPISVEPIGVCLKPTVLPVMLTKSERKKIRKQRRRETELEKQEKIRLGFIEKPEDKVRMSNLMRVLGTDAVQDPTKITAHVKAQVAERLRKHEEANAERKLTPEQRRAKKLKKLKEDVSTSVHVTVYRVKDLSNLSNKFKVDMNAQQYHLTGCVLLYHDVNLVIVEGGPKALKKYKRLMLHRIKWIPDMKIDDDDSDAEEELKIKKQNSCIVVWEGISDTRSFSDWRMKVCQSETIAREHLKKHNAEHYWDMALSSSIVEQEQD